MLRHFYQKPGKLISMMLAVLLLAGCLSTSVAAMPSTADIMMIETFEDYFGDSDMFTTLFGGPPGAHKNVTSLVGFASKQGYEDSGAMAFGGIYLEGVMESGGMVMPTMKLKGNAADWKGASYVQFWAKNPNDAPFQLRFELTSGGQSHCLNGNTAKTTVYMEKRPGDGIFQLVTTPGNRRINIPAGYEGFIKIPLDRFPTLTDYSAITQIYLGANIGTVTGLVMYLDEFAVVTENYVQPKTREYPAEIENDFIRMNYKTMQARYSCEVIYDNPVSAKITYKDPSGKVFDNNTVTTNSDMKFVYYCDMPADSADGQYTVELLPEGYDKAITYTYQYTKRILDGFSDTIDTKYERAANFLSQLGIITGYEDGTFRPEQEITRAEFAALAVRALALADEAKQLASAPFDDTGSHWSAGNIAIGVQKGIINGYGDGNFGPDDTVTYEQAVKMLVAMLGYDSEAAAAGGYPDGYMKVAGETGVTVMQDAKGNPAPMNITDNKAPRGVVAQLILNALRVSTSENGSITNRTLLSENFEAAMDTLRFDSVKAFADTILTYGRDTYGSVHSPLLTSGIDVYTYEPAAWVFEGDVWIPNNLSSQQNLTRTMVSLTNLTGDQKYKKVMEDQLNYYFENLSDSNGLMYHGAHWWQDILSDDQRGEIKVLEYKSVYPYYDFMYEVNPEATVQYMKALWNSLVIDWSVLEITRHGNFDKKMGALWDSAWVGMEPFTPTKGLSFFNAGSDLMYAGAKLFTFTGENGAYTWAERLLQQYVDSAHPKTGIFGTQYTQPIKSKELPDDWEATMIESNQFTSNFGDRAKLQFGADFGDVALEGWYMPSVPTNIAPGSIMLLSVYENLGGKAQNFYDWTIRCLKNYLKYAYDAERNVIKPIFADGTNLEGYERKTNGYYGKKGTVLNANAPALDLFNTCSIAYKHSKDIDFWTVCVNMAKDLNLGDIGNTPGVNLNVNLATDCRAPEMLYAIIDLYEATGVEDYLKLAKAIANNIVLDGFVNNFFMTPNGEFVRNKAKFDCYEPHAILMLESLMQGKRDLIPDYIGGWGYIEGPHDAIGGSPSDDKAIFLGRFDWEY